MQTDKVVPDFVLRAHSHASELLEAHGRSAYRASSTDSIDRHLGRGEEEEEKSWSLLRLSERKYLIRYENEGRGNRVLQGAG